MSTDMMHFEQSRLKAKWYDVDSEISHPLIDSYVKLMCGCLPVN
jgi:hypothetical protein